MHKVRQAVLVLISDHKLTTQSPDITKRIVTGQLVTELYPPDLLRDRETRKKLIRNARLILERALKAPYERRGGSRIARRGRGKTARLTETETENEKERKAKNENGKHSK